MKPPSVVALTLLTGCALCASGARGTEEATVSGSHLFKRYCVVCHGPGGEGDGTLATSLKYVPSDLTVLARHNRGEFPRDRVRQVIDGRKPVPGHGGPEMPAWSDVLRKSRDGYDDAVVAAQIDALTSYVEELQAREPAN